MKQVAIGASLLALGALAGFRVATRGRRSSARVPELLVRPSATPVKFHSAPTINANDLAGRSVAVAYNLHECPAGSSPAPGETCYTIRAKPRARVEFVTSAIALEHVRFWVSRASLRSIRKKGQREVCCYLLGTVVSMQSPDFVGHARDHDAWTQIRFSPHRDDGFVTAPLDGSSPRLVTEARYVLMAARVTLATGVVFGPPIGPRERGRRPR